VNSAIVKRKSTSIAHFKPEETRIKDEQLSFLIESAKALKKWEALAKAVDEKLKEQARFVKWWDASVQRPGGDKKSKNHSRRTGLMISLSEAEKNGQIPQQKVSKWRRRLQEPDKYRAMLYGAAYHKAMVEAVDTTATKWTGDPESYTPTKYLETARAVMGGIDLDPASNGYAQKAVAAAEWYDESENGLLQQWKGTVFLNPPYKHPLVAQFIDKLCRDYQDGNITQAILLTNNNTDTKWWHQAAKIARAVCFTAGRINFYKADGSETQPTNGQTFFYFGRDVKKFAVAFSAHGLIMVTHAA